VDGKGVGFATGYAELDRLLGAAPRFKRNAHLQGARFSFGSTGLSGALASAKGAGLIGPAGALKLSLGWTAKGPFRAGPVEVSGDAKGTGAITGTVAAPRADLVADFATVELPRLTLTGAHLTLSFLRGPGGADGALAITADSQYGPARARTDFRFAEGGLDLSGLDADAGGIKASGALALRQGRPSTADLVVAIGPGVLLTEGSINGSARIVDAAGGARATLDLTARNAALVGASGLRLSAATITANGPLERLPVTIDGRGLYRANAWRFKGSGFFAQRAGNTGLALDGEGRFGSAEFRTLETARIGFGGGQRFADLNRDLEGGRPAIPLRAHGPGPQGEYATPVPAPEAGLSTPGSFDAGGTLPERNKAFVAAYRAKYKTDPDLYAAHGFDAMKVLVEAVRDGNKSASTFWNSGDFMTLIASALILATTLAGVLAGANMPYQA